ncbi:aminotransferase class I/II-fold pyridoxal phosphate-dependent enzyme [Paenibacillus alginolyticus]|uniref:Aminotransferase class I/II-fold pyridoxal phosphate-dependent enzyme n=1 Tax=Paenibacillus alginolyticus TaxID=59839 RepID=A0ABT4GHD0_9BACL|nr:aminotransferase class I/II-fold pyridoxal phosphate-dependent enzyme [Paenibacillus alginolyticus]MCY9670290.1 aminotransferase class I/II-fold pyridoxal phosphate-dependent enzyme [Paenibacillus alginolyticus]MCY9695591.1 aminotransferase class I/II-fold pyridoxal phosphate-dependent enzyme [Paenibacillus alginolyticus]MEC0148247.1 aminotransferase class V-fold PLP-dependent enzyme [Paenibacillus alginolyticus]
MDHQKTPLFTALVQHAASDPLPFHIPGHKKGKGMDPEFRAFVGDNALSIDLINIVPLDDLHQPSGVIREAEQLAADAFGADYTLFSIQGTTGAIMTMIMSVCSPGDKIIIPRNAHKSILSAVIFAGAIPVWVSPEKDDRLGIEHGVTTKSVLQALEQNSDVKAVLIINPTYYGTSIDLLEMVELVHSYGIPVLVDEAHGTLIHFHEDLPLSAMQAGADMAATSVHKLGGSLTQSSILNVKGNRVSIERIRTLMSMLTTTSTSYLLLASLDTARRQLAVNGQTLAEKTISLAQYARRQINEIPGFYCYGDEILKARGVFHYDPTKLCIHLGQLGISGYEAEQWLRANDRIEVELSDLTNILCLITLGDSEQEVNLLLHALWRMSAAFNPKEEDQDLVPPMVPEATRFVLSPRDAFYADTEKAFFQQSCGRVIAEFIYVYPPGIPILMPGQMISQEIIDYIKLHLEAGLPVKGPEDPSIQKIRVVVTTQQEILSQTSRYVIPD